MRIYFTFETITHPQIIFDEFKVRTFYVTELLQKGILFERLGCIRLSFHRLQKMTHATFCSNFLVTKKVDNFFKIKIRNYILCSKIYIQKINRINYVTFLVYLNYFQTKLLKSAYLVKNMYNLCCIYMLKSSSRFMQNWPPFTKRKNYSFKFYVKNVTNTKCIKM